MSTADRPHSSAIRWIIDLMGLAGIVLASGWLLIGFFGGLGMGWGGRSGLEIVAAVLLFLLFPVIASIYLARKASTAAKRGQQMRGVLLAAGALLAAPAAWMIGKLGILG